jgi:hypothetical protein
MDAYEYRPIDLKGKAFRLLRLRKGVGSDIECDLISTQLYDENSKEYLKNHIHYEAVSYTWGIIDLSASIKVDGKKFGVTENLYLALQYLSTDEDDRILWIDAICIDQSNREERGHQVRQMGRIYSQADRVVIWLGPATDDTNVLMDSLKRLEQESNKKACKDWALADHQWKDLWTSLQLELQSRHWNMAVRQRAGLESLLRRPWFERIWILQEVAKAKRAIVCSGSNYVSTRIFVLAPSLLHTKVEPGCQAVLDIMPGPPRRESWWNMKPDLYTLLTKFIGSKAGDPRDMIYALLGICSDTPDDSVINVDYKKEPEEVFRDAALFLFDLSDCSYSTVHELMRDVTYLNSSLFLRKVQSEDENRVRNFLRLRGGTIEVTEKVVRAAAENSKSGPQIIKLLLDRRGSEMLAVVAQGSIKEMENLLNYQGGRLKVTEEVVKAAAGNAKSGKQVMKLLLDRRGDEVKITEEVVNAAARNSESGPQIIKLLFDRRGDEVKITYKVRKAAEENTRSGKQMKRLLDHWRRGEAEELVEAAAGNTRSGKKGMKLLLDRRGDEARITEEVVEAAAGDSESEEQVIKLLLERQASEVEITEQNGQRRSRKRKDWSA